MANSIYKVHEMINKVGFEFDDVTAKKVAQLATKAGKLAADGMTTELSSVASEIGDIFNKALAQMGKKPIDLASILKMPGSDAIGKLADSFVAQLTGSVSSALNGVEAQFNELIKKRDRAVQEVEALQNKHRIKIEESSKLDEAYNALISNRNQSGADNDELAAHTQDVLSDFMAINDELLEMEEKGKVNASTLKKWLVTAKELSTIYNTIQNMDPMRRAKISPQIGKVNMQYFLDGQYDDDIEYGTSIVDEFIDNNDFTDAIEVAQKKVSDLNVEISKLTQQHPELVSEQSAVEAEERLNRVKEAFDRLLVSRGKNKGEISEKGVQAIHAALKYNPKGSKIPAVDQGANIEKMQKAKEATEKALTSLDKLGNAYLNSAGSSWEVRATHLIKFVKEYESLMDNPNVNQELIAGWTDTYNQLKPMFAESQAMLQSVYQMTEGKEPVDMSNIGVEVEASEQVRIADEASANAKVKARVEAEAKAQADIEAAEAEAKAMDYAEAKAKADAESAAAAARRAELVGQLDSYRDEPLTSQEADDNLKERERILQQLRDEGLLTEELENNYNEINKRLETRANLIRQAEGYYDDVDDVLTGARVSSIDDEAQYRRDHIKPFDDTIGRMQDSGLFSEDEIDRFLAISDAMEERIRTVTAEANFEKLDTLYDETDDITDADRLNNILEERKQILASIENVTADYLDYSDEIEHQKAINTEIEKRIVLLRDAAAGRINVADIDDILQENGDLESKLERLSDISQDWGIKIKDGEEEEAIDELEAFEETYDRIVLKLANGRNVEILPNAKGLRALYKYSDGLDSDVYGETEIDDVEFVRKSTQAHQENTAAINAEMQAQEHLNQSKLQQHQIEKSDADSYEVAEENAKTEALKQQNVALQDNAKLKAQATGQGAGMGIEGAVTITPTPTVPAGVISAEATELETVRAKVLEVTNAVNSKTQAFLAEQKAVKSSAQSEIHSLSQVEKGVNAVRVALSNMKAGKHAVNIDVTGGENVEATTTKAMAALQKLRASLSLTTKAVDAKTSAFTMEGASVGKVIGKEISGLIKLKTHIDDVQRQLSGMEAAIQNVKTASNGLQSVVSPTANNTVSDQAQTINTLLGLYQDLGYQQEALQNAEAQKDHMEASFVNRRINELEGLIAMGERAINVTEILREQFSAAKASGAAGWSNLQPKQAPAPDAYLDRKKDVQFSSLSLMYEKLSAAGKLTDELKAKWGSLWDSLDKVKNQEDLSIWRDELIMTRNAMQEIMIANKLVTDESKASFQQLIAITKLYNKMAIGATRATTPEAKAVYEQEANNALVEQQNILRGITLTKEQQAKFDELEIERARQINLVQAQQTGRQKQIHDAQVEAEVVRRLVKLYEQLGHAQFLGNAKDASALRQQIGAERANLSSVDYATDMKFRAAKEKGYNAEQTKANNAALKEQESIVKRLTALYQEYGVLIERAGATKGANLRSEIAEQAADKESEILALRQSLDVITSEMAAGFDAAFDRGKAIESARQYEAIAKSMDADELARAKQLGVEYEKLAQLQARADLADGGNEKQYLQELVVKQQELINLKQQGLNIDPALYNTQYLKAYEAELDKLNLQIKKQQDAQDKKSFKQQIKEDQQEAGVSKSKTVANKAVDTLVQAGQIQGISPDQQANLDVYQSKIEELRNTIANFPKDGLATDDQKNQLITQRLEVDAYTKEIQELIANYERLSGDNATVLGSSKLGLTASADAYKQELTETIMAQTQGRASVKAYDAETRTLTYTLGTGRGEFTQYTASVRQADGALVSVRGTTTKAMGAFEAIGKKIKEYSYYFTGSMMIMRAISWVREGITVIKDIDAALTELKKVTDETEESYENFLNTAAKTADKVGSTIKDVVSSTADWARLGYSMKEAHTLATSTQVLMNVSEFDDVSKATDTLISSIQAFKYTAEESMDVVDILNTIGNNYAISTADLATSLTKSSGSLVAANGTLEEAVALTATANTIIQDADVVGTALKTVAMRLRGTSTEEMEAEGLDTDGAVTSTSKLRSKVKALSGVDILTDAGAYKSTYQILADIAKVWEDISDIDQAALLELLAGKRAGSVMSAILQNPETLKDAFESASDASGSALEENEKYLDSIQGRIDLFKNAVQTMWQNAINSDFVKMIVNLGKTLITIIDKIGLLNSAIVAIAIIIKKTSKNTWAGFFKSIGTSITGLNKKLTSFATRLGLVKAASAPAQASIRSVTTAMIQQQLAAHGVSEADQKLILSKMGLNSANQAQVLSSKSAALSALQEAAANQTLTGTQAVAIARKLGLITATKGLNVAQASTIMRMMGVDRATRMGIISTLGLTTQTKKLTKAEILDALAKNGIEDAALKARIANLMLAASQGDLIASLRLLGMGIKDFIAKNALLIFILAVAAAIRGLVALVDWLTVTMEEATEKFKEFQSELEATEEKLKDLESELQEVKDRIDELYAQDSLTFTDKEELERLQAQSAELQRQIDLNEQLRVQQQKQVNDQAIKTADMYKDVGVNSGKTTAERSGAWAKWGGGAAAVGTGIAGYLGAGAAIGVAAGPVGAIVGALVGLAAGAIIGAIGGYTAGEQEKKVGDSLENMKEQSTKLAEQRDKKQKKYSKKATKGRKKRFDKAQQELDDYNAMMAENLSELDAYYSSIDLSVYDPIKDAEKIKELRNEMNEFYDIQDKWAIQSSGANAKTNAISRIFGENASPELQNIKKEIESALKAGEDFDFDGAFDDDFKERLHVMGLTVAEVKRYFLDLKKAEEEAEEFTTYDAVKSVADLTDKVESLKDAFDEFNESGIVTAKTLVALQESFGHMGDKWMDFVDIMTSGTSSTAEAKEAVNELIETLITSALAGEKIDTEQYVALWSQLTNLGVGNASELLTGIKDYAAIGEEIAGDILNNEKTVEQAIADYEKANGVMLTAEQKEVVRATYSAKAAQSKADAYTEQANTLDVLTSEYETAKAAEDELEDAVEDSKDEKSGKFLGFLWKTRTDEDRRNTNDITANEEAAEKNRKAYEKQIQSLYSEIFGDAGTKDSADEQLVELQTYFENPQNYDELSEAAQKKLDELNDTLGLEVDFTFEDPQQLVDDVQSIFDTLKDAVNEFNENGYLSVDTAQALIDPEIMDPKYLTLLEDENGQLKLNEDALYDIAIARLTYLGVKQQDAILTAAENDAKDGSIDKLRESTEVLYGEADALQAVNMQRIKSIRTRLEERQASGDLVGFDIDAYIANITSQVNAVGSIIQSAKDNVRNSLSTSGNTDKAEASDAFQKAMDYYENRIGAEQSRFEQVQNEIDLLEKQGKIAGEDYYQEQIDSEERRLSLLQQQKAEAKKYLGQFKEGSDDWWSVANTLNDIENEIDDVTSSIQDLSDAMADVDWKVFEEAHKRYGDIHDDLDTMRELLSPNAEEDWFDDEGMWTDNGTAYLATYITDLQYYEGELADVTEELQKYSSPYEGNEETYKKLGIDSEQELYDKRRELLDQQYEIRQSMSDTQQSVKDMYESQIDAVEEWANEATEAYQDYIDVVKEALDAERD